MIVLLLCVLLSLWLSLHWLCFRYSFQCKRCRWSQSLENPPYSTRNDFNHHKRQQSLLISVALECEKRKLSYMLSRELCSWISSCTFIKSVFVCLCWVSGSEKEKSDFAAVTGLIKFHIQAAHWQKQNTKLCCLLSAPWCRLRSTLHTSLHLGLK